MSPRNSSVQIMTSMSEGKLRSIWDRLPHNPMFWGDYQCDSFEAFKKLFANSALILEFPFGAIRVAKYIPNSMAEIHGVFWSAAVLHSPEAFKDATQILSELLHVYYFSVTVPTRRKTLHNLLYSLGFSMIRLIPEGFKTRDGMVDATVFAKVVERSTI